MRDTQKNSEYWEHKIPSQIVREDKFYQVYIDESQPIKKRRNAGNALVGIKLETALSRYSVGVAIAEIAPDLISSISELFPALIKSFPPGSEFFIPRPGYSVTHRKIASLILCNADNQMIRNFFDAFDQFDLERLDYHGYDKIWAAYRSYFNLPLSKKPTQIHWPSAFESLWNAIDPDEPDFARARHIRVFLDGWYKEMASESAAKTELLGPNVTPNSYVGYWCLEAAAAVVMMDIDDSSFRDHPHYPKDWADWARQQKRVA